MSVIIYNISIMKTLKQIDMFGHPIALNYSKNGSTYNTFCGSIFTLMIYILMGILIVVKINTLVTFDDDTIIKNEEIFDPDNYKDHTINIE